MNGKTKKIIKKADYKKGTIATDKNEIIKVIEASSEIEIKAQTIYDDDSQSISLVVHYLPNDVKRN